MQGKAAGQRDTSSTYSRSKSRGTDKNSQKEQVEVTINMGQQRTPIAVHVPLNCNMKILKSILWFQLKKNLTVAECSCILGFQTSPSNYQMDYQLQMGIGQLKKQITLTPFLKNTKHPPSSLLNYKICRIISQGGFSKVYLLRNYQTGQFQAGKFILKQNGNNLDLVKNQYKIAKRLNNKFIIKTHQFIETQTFFIIVMEYAPGGQLFELIRINPKMKEWEARFFIIETLLALKYLHGLNFIYRDVKPQNIILDHSGHIKLTDFGLAKKGNERSYSFCGSLDYMAPEVITDYGYNYEVDYYSVGNLMYELLVGSPPFYHPSFSHEETKYHILNTQVFIPSHAKMSKLAVDLIEKLLEKDPQYRLGHYGGIDEILQHKWFKDADINSYLMKDVEPPFQGQSIFMKQGLLSGNNQNKEWQNMIDRDIKQMQIKAIYHRKNTNAMIGFGKRHQSMEDEVDKKISTLPSSPNHRSNKKLKTNMSLLYVLTHKRSNSHSNTQHKSGNYESAFSTPGISVLKSPANSRKSSIFGKNQITKCKISETLNSDEKSQPLSNNFVEAYSKKSKQNGNGGIFKKKGKEGRKVVFVKK